MAKKSRKKVGECRAQGWQTYCLSSLCPWLLCQTLLINPYFHKPATRELFDYRAMAHCSQSAGSGTL